MRFLSVVLFVACQSSAPGPCADASSFASRRFVHPLPACPPDPLYNCTPSLELCSGSNRAYMLVTDIVNVGTYLDGNATLRTEFPSGDVPPAIRFGYQAIDVLVDDWLGWTWTLDPAPMFSSCE
jgi:hypothetical protein